MSFDDFTVPELDSFNLLARRVAGVGESEIVLSDARIANHRVIFVNVMVYPAPSAGNAGTERPYLWFNDDRALVYEASHRSFVSTLDIPSPTETPAVHHVTSAGRLYLLPSGTSYQLGSADVFSCWMVIERHQEAVEKVRAFEWWTLGESTYTGTNKHPRYGHMVAQFLGTEAGTPISKIGLSFDAIGRMGAGSGIAVYGLRSPLLDGGWDYNDDASASTTAIWGPTSKAMFRRVMKVSPIPAPGANGSLFALADTSFAIGTMNVSEVWIVDESAGISESPHSGISFSVKGTNLEVVSAAGGKNWSGYDYAHVVLTWARP